MPAEPLQHLAVPLDALPRARAPEGRLWRAENEQCVRVSDVPLHPRRLATTSSAARQWLAWLSPTSATEADGGSARRSELDREFGLCDRGARQVTDALRFGR